MEREQLEYSKQILAICKSLPENFYHEHLESLYEIAIIFKYTKGDKLVAHMEQFGQLISNLQICFDVFSKSPENIFCQKDLDIAITNLHYALLEMRETLGITENRSISSSR